MNRVITVVIGVLPLYDHIDSNLRAFFSSLQVVTCQVAVSNETRLVCLNPENFLLPSFKLATKVSNLT